MKLLIPFLILLPSLVHSDVKVEISKGGVVMYGAEFETLAEANLWKSKQVANESWGANGTYVLVETDITTEIAAKEAEEVARKTDFTAIKGMVSNINNSTLPQWHKRLLKRLIKEHVRGMED